MVKTREHSIPLWQRLTSGTFIPYVQKIPLNPMKNIKSNLSKEETEAINTLKNNPDIINKEADKGSGIVVMSKEFYSSQIYQMLKDKDTYIQLEEQVPDTKI